MKKIGWISFTAVLCILCLPVFSGQTNSVRVTRVYGNVYTDKNIPVQEGDWLGLNSVIRTGVDSYAEMELGPGNSVRLKENAGMSVKEIQRTADDPAGAVVKLVDFDLLEGDIILKLKNLPEDALIRVSSPTAVAGVRGTSFIAGYNPADRGSRVGVFEGLVEVASAGEPGKTAKVPAFKKVNVTPWGTAMPRVRGNGILSETILGKDFIDKSSAPVIEAVGRGETEEIAKDRAYFALARQVLVIPVSSEKEKKIEDILNEDPGLCEQVYARIFLADIAEISEINGEKKVVLRLPVLPISKIIGFPVPSMPAVVKQISEEEYSGKFGALARLTTQRAAQLDGYRKFAENIYGSVISSETVLRDMIAENDRITTVVEGVVRGAEIVETNYFSDGSISVVMTISAVIVRDQLVSAAGNVFGFNYFTSPEIVDMEDFLAYMKQ